MRQRLTSSAALLLAAAGCALVVALTGCSRSSGPSRALASERPTQRAPRAAVSRPYTLMQMNLCLSGIASCYGKVAYPAVVNEAVTRVQEAHPDAVTFNEACANDVELIARRTGYHLRFSNVIYAGSPLHCVRPNGRGLFGDAVLTKAAVEYSDSHAFKAQAGIERREWLCVITQAAVEVCTAHLNERTPIELPGNDAQCRELAALLERADARTIIFGGDVNRRGSCAPDRFWIRSDRAAQQAPGFQQVYGTRALRSPSAEVVLATHTDHDVLLVRARLTAQG